MLQNGFIISKSVNEFQRVKTEIENTIRSRNQEMVSYVIAPTLSCNLRCRYCFQKDFRTDGSDQIITEETLFSVIQFILQRAKENRNLKTIRITWFGGEPTLCCEKIVDFSRLLKKELSERNIELITSIITNGSLLDETKLRTFVYDCNLRSIQITVDGMETTYCDKKQTVPAVFHKVLDNIQIATKYTKTIVRVNADKTNVEELKALVKMLYKSNVNKNNLNIHFAQLREYGNQQCAKSFVFNDLEYFKSKDDFYSSIEEYGANKSRNKLPMFSIKPYCGLSIGGNLVIDYLGNLYKCEHYIGDKIKIIGNITEGIFYNDKYLNFLSLATDSRCESCNLFPCCNYAQCEVMHNFTGNGQRCDCYQYQMEAIKLQVKKYLETT